MAFDHWHFIAIKVVILWFSYINPWCVCILSYAAWSPLEGQREQVQHRFTRMFPGLRKLSYADRLQTLGLWSLEEIRNRSDLLEVFRMYKGLSRICFSSIRSAVLQLKEDTQSRSPKIDVVWTRGVTSSASESSTAGTAFLNTSLTLRPLMSSNLDWIE